MKYFVNEMASIVLKTLSILLGLFFIFVGLMKVTNKLNRDMHKDLKKSFVQYAKVFPLSQHLGFKISSKWYRRTVGIAEAICGLILVFVPGCTKEVANVVLLVLMVGAVYTHQAIGDKFERMAPSIVFTFMLTCRLVVYVQVRRKASRESKAEVTTQPQTKTSYSAPVGTSGDQQQQHPNDKQIKQD